MLGKVLHRWALNQWWKVRMLVISSRVSPSLASRATRSARGLLERRIAASSGHGLRSPTWAHFAPSACAPLSNGGSLIQARRSRSGAAPAGPLRPARHDPAPDKDGSKQILRVHTRSAPLADDVDLDSLATTTGGMVGTDLEHLTMRRRCWRRGARMSTSR
jgi:hypothetical protein